MTTSTYFFNTISSTKDLDQFTPEEIKKDYSPYVVNRMVGGYGDLIYFADAMNNSHNIPKYQQLNFYTQLIPKRKRRVTYSGKKKNEDLNLVMESYNITQEKADPLLKILTEEQKSDLRVYLNKGGKN